MDSSTLSPIQNGTPMKSTRILSVGSGRRAAEPGVIRLDYSPKVSPDVVWDLNTHPYPFDDDSFGMIECFDVIEHLLDIPKTMQEFHRILVPNGVLKITTPHFSCSNSYTDPTHWHHLGYYSFDYFSDSHDLNYYSNTRYDIQKRWIQFQGGRFNRSVVSRLANRYPDAYEKRWTWMFPAWYLYFELLALKS